MNYKTTYILFGVLVGILVLIGVVLLIEPTPYVDTSRYVLPSAHEKKTIASDAVTRVEIDRTRPEPQTIVFERDPESSRWTITSPRAYRANNSVVEELVRQVLNAEANAKAAVPADRKAAELEPPAEIVTLKTKDGKEFKLDVGGEGGFGKGVAYLTSSDKPAIMAVPRDAVASLFKKLDAFRDPYLLASSPGDYQRVKLTLSKTDKTAAPKGSLVLLKKSEGLWEYKDPEGYDGSADMGDAHSVPPTGVDGLLKDLSDIKVEQSDKSSGFVEDDAKDLAKYNLDPAKSDVLTIDVDRVDSIKTENGEPQTKTSPITVLVGVGKKVDDKAAEPKYYALLKGEHGNTVVEIPTKGPDAVAALFKDPAKLCNHSLAALPPSAKPVAVDVANGFGKLEFRRENGDAPWHLYHNGVEIPLSKEVSRDPNGDPVQRFVNQLVQKVPVASFLDPKADQAKLGLNKPTATVSIWVEGVEKQEEKADDKKDAKEKDKKAETKTRYVLAKDKVDKPASKLTFGAVEGKEVVVKRQAFHQGWDESALVKTPDFLLDVVKEGPLAYEDKELPSFNGKSDPPDKDVVKVALDRGGVHTVIARANAKPETPWTFEEPKDLAGRKASTTAVEQILATLHGLRATRLVAETAKEDELDKEYGLKTPVLKAVVTKEDKTSYTYDFGKDAAGGGEYGRQSQRPMIFVVDKSRLEALQKDLRDPTIFAVADASKIKRLKLTGWVNVTGTPTTWDFERNAEGKWVVKTPMPNTIAVDQDKVRVFAEGLAHLTAKRFASQDAKLKAAFDKDEDKTALSVEMTVEGQEKPLQLKVVNLTSDKAALGNDKGYYATSPSAPGELFEVAKELFDGPMSKPAYFIKPEESNMRTRRIEASVDRRGFLRGTAAALPFFWSGVGMLTADDAPAKLIPRETNPNNLESPFAALNKAITPNELFYVRNHFAQPRVQKADWRLQVIGAVERPLELTYDQLLNLPPVTRTVTLECAGNGRAFLTPKAKGVQWELGAVSTAKWTGVPLSKVLEKAGLKTDAVEVILEGRDKGELKSDAKPAGAVPFARSLPMAKAQKPEVLLAYKMNGAVLPEAHGFPLRAVVGGWYGVASVKWLARIIVADRAFKGFFQAIDYAYWERRYGLPTLKPITEMDVKAEIAQPEAGATVAANATVRVHGAAWAGESEPAKVEVSTDGGKAWAEAKLLGESAPAAWRLWEYNWKTPAGGNRVLMARATDKRGRVQPMERDPDLRNYRISHVHPTEVVVKGEKH